MPKLAKNIKEHSLNQKSSNLDEPEEQEFPVFAFEGILKDFALEVAKVNDVDPTMCLLSGLAIISASAGKSYVALNGSKHEGGTYLNLYTLISAPSSSGKGIVLKNTIDPLHFFEKEIHEKHRSEIPRKKAQLATFLKRKKEMLQLNDKRKKAEKNLDDIEDTLTEIQSQIDELSPDEKILHGPKPILIDNASPEAMAIAMKEANGTLFSVSSESGDIISIIHGKYQKGENDFTLVLKGFSGDRTEYRRTTRAIVRIEEPCLSILWMAQPYILGKLIHGEQAKHQGLTARVLFAKGRMILEPEKIDELSINEKVKCSWHKKITDILSFRHQTSAGHEIVFAKEAKEYLRRFHNERKEQINTDLSGYKNELRKSREIAIRVAGVLALAETEDSKPVEINLEQTQRAVEIVKFCQQELMNEIKSKRILSKAEYANNLESKLKEENKISETIRNLGRMGYDVEEVEEVVGTYDDRFEIIKQEAGKKGGRPSRILRLKTQE